MNGWTNFETWAVASWIQNVRPFHDQIHQSGRVVGEDLKEMIRGQLAEELAVPDSLARTLLFAALDQVNFEEIAGAFSSDVSSDAVASPLRQ